MVFWCFFSGHTVDSMVERFPLLGTRSPGWSLALNLIANPFSSPSTVYWMVRLSLVPQRPRRSHRGGSAHQEGGLGRRRGLHVAPPACHSHLVACLGTDRPHVDPCPQALAVERTSLRCLYVVPIVSLFGRDNDAHTTCLTTSLFVAQCKDWTSKKPWISMERTKC